MPLLALALLAPPVLFHQGAVSDPATPQWEFALTPDGRRFFYATQDSEERRYVAEQRIEGGAWTPAAPIAGTVLGTDGGASMDAAGTTLFFGSSRDGADARDLYALDLTDEDAVPVRITDTPGVSEIDLAIDRQGSGFLWTASRYDGAPGMGFYRVRYADGALDVLGDASDLHAAEGENRPYVDPEGRYLLFANYEVDPEGGDEDLFVSTLEDGVPGLPVSLGPAVNTRYGEASPQVTADGQTLLFTSDRPHPGGQAGDSQIWQIPVASVPALAEAAGLGPALTPAGPVMDVGLLEKRDDRLFAPGTDEPFTGVVTERYESGARKMRRGVADGRASGVWLEWYEDGTPRYYGEWRDGLGDGTWLYFHENGELRSRDEAEADVWDGASESWNADGEKTRDGIFVGGTETGARDFGGTGR